MRASGLFLLVLGCGGDSVSAADAGGVDALGTDSKVDSSATDSGADTSVADGSVVDASDASMTPDAGAGTYTAYALIGGYDRVVIFKSDPQHNVCFELRLVSPPQSSGGLTLPSMWGFESAKVTHDSAACVKQYMGAAQTWPVASQAGVTSWAGYLPKTLDIDVTLTFSGQPNWAPATEQLKATALVVN